MLALHLVSSLKGDSSAAHVVHFFCSRDHGRNNGGSILRGLIYQLLSQRPSLFGHILDDYDKHGASLFGDRKFQALWNIFTRMLHDKDISPITCILDGLDECDEEGLECFWLKIDSLYKCDPQRKPKQSTHSLKLLVVSRNHPYSIEQAMDKFPRLRLEPDNKPHVGSDISKFVDNRMSSLLCPSETREYIRKELCNRSEGTYLWIGFAINALNKVRVIDMERTVKSFPHGLDAMYRRMLLGVRERERGRVIEILRWVTGSFRPLTLLELAVAVNTIPTRGQTLEEAVADEITYAGDLLTINLIHNNRTQVVSFVHSSVLDYFQSIPQNDVSLESFRLQAIPTHDHLAHRLLDYTLQTMRILDESGVGIITREVIGYKATRGDVYPLFDYALLYGIGNLLQLGDMCLVDNYHQLLDPTERYHNSWLQGICLVVYQHSSGESVTVAHLAALEGLINVLDYFHTNQDVDINVEDGNGQSLLFYATLGQQLETMAWLLMRKANPNAQDVYGQTPLHIAARCSRLELAEILIRHGSRTGIHTGHTGSIRDDFMVCRDAFDTQRGPTYRAIDPTGNPPQIAARIGNIHVLNLLLKPFLREGGSINGTDEYGNTLLHQIVISNQRYPRSCWSDLFQSSSSSTDFDPDILNKDGESALHIATRLYRPYRPGTGFMFQEGFAEHSTATQTIWNSVMALVEIFGATVDVQTTTGETPLHRVCRAGDNSLLNYLIRKGAKAGIRDQWGQNALHWLCSERQFARKDLSVIMSSLAHTMTLADIEARRFDGQTARELAIKRDDCYIEYTRLHENGLKIGLGRRTTPLRDSLSAEVPSLWSMHFPPWAFEELHSLIDCSLVIIKAEGSKKDLDFLEQIVSKHPHLQHWLDKRRRYQDSVANN